MTISLDPAVEAKLDSGRYVLLHLVKFDIPGAQVGYWRGARDLTWNGFTYKPSRYLDDAGLNETLGVDITQRSLTFSDVPTSDENDIIAKVEQYNYLNVPVIVTKLIGDTENDSIAGIAETSDYEINKINYDSAAVSDDGARQVTTEISLEIPGRIVRDNTGFKLSSAEQQAHNDPTDTFFDYTATSATWPEEWGQVTR
ncbi:MAG: DUF2163 domain-containing protein [Hyphomicrobiales bacterium]|nr:MAG: DUF2163 domain-containing protein [Hyphomicrobiales bacterium]